MAMSASALNSARYTSCLADITVQFPINTGLPGAEQTSLASYQSKLAHAMADHEGTDVVAAIVGNATVTVASVGGVTTGSGTSGPGTGVVSA